MPNDDHLGIRADFDRLVNMSVEEMQRHFASPESDYASLHPPIAARLKQKSGKTLGKHALVLKQKEEWDDTDVESAKSIVLALKWQLGRRAAFQKEDGSKTPFTVSLMNRGHDPIKGQSPVAEEGAQPSSEPVAQPVSEVELGITELRSRCQSAITEYLRSYMGGEFPDDLERPWVRDVFQAGSYAIVEWEGGLIRVPYQLNGVNVEILPEITDVTITYEPVQVAIADDTVPGELTDVAEATDSAGPSWTGYMIRAGFAKNLGANGKPRLYTEEALEAAVAEGLFDNLPGYQRTDPEHGEEEGTVVAGTWGKAAWDAAARAVKNTFTWVKEKYPALMHQKIKVALTEGKRDQLPGFSITGNVIVDSTSPNIIRKIVEVRSCDPISFPSAGGELLAITESHIKESDTMKIKITEALKAKGLTVPAALEKRWETVTVAEGAAADFMIAQLKDKKSKLFDKMPDLEAKLGKDETMLVALFEDFMAAEGVDVKSPDDSPGADAPAVPATEGQRIAESVTPALVAQLNAQAVDGVLASSGLDEIQKGAIRKQFVGQPFNPVAVREAVRDALAMQEAYSKAEPRKTRVDVQKDGVDKLQQAANDFFCSDITEMPIRESVLALGGKDAISKDHRGAMRSLRGLYVLMTGDSDLTFDLHRVRESIDPATIAKIFQNAMNLRLLREYVASNVYEGWKLLADVTPLADFKRQETMRTGYFGSLVRIDENDTYPELAQGGKLDASYTPETYGGMISVHRKQIINDNVGEVRRIPGKVAIGAKLDLSRFVWSLILDNPDMGDGTALFHSDHNNLLEGNAAAAGLSETTLTTLDGKLKDQEWPGRSDKLMLPAKYVIIPANQAMRKKLYEVMSPAFGQNNSVPTFAQSMQVQGIECPHASDADDWYVATDKAINEILEVGFFQGREEPEILIADNDLSGALFTHDKVQYKVRHEYGGSVVDFRGIAKAAVTT